MFGNGVLRKIVWPKGNVTGQWRKLHSETHHNSYISTNIIPNIKSRRIRWAGHMAHMGERRSVYKVFMVGLGLD